MSRSPEARRESPVQRLIATALRTTLGLLLKPGMRAGRPVESQRRHLARVTRATLPLRGVGFEPATVGGVRGEWARDRSG
jgi:hypothetical protein